MNLERILMLSAGFTVAALAMGSVYAFNEFNRKPVSVRPAHVCGVKNYRAFRAEWVKDEGHGRNRRAAEKTL